MKRVFFLRFRTMMKNILGQAIYQLTVTFGMMFFGEQPLPPPSLSLSLPHKVVQLKKSSLRDMLE
jgi:hypothetical protein